MAEPFKIRFTVRAYEVDMNGHLTGAAYIQWADHVRYELSRVSGVRWYGRRDVGPINLETTVRYHRELRVDDDVDVSCEFVWGEGKTFRVEQEFRAPDGTLVAEVDSVCGILDLKERRLVPDPRERWDSIVEARG